MQAQQQISFDDNQKRIGQHVRVLIEEELSGEWRGRTEADAPEVDNEIYVRSDMPLTVGEFVIAEVEDASEFDLFATAVR
jgi:ribosomal protein S12 methylthiotransferase